VRARLVAQAHREIANPARSAVRVDERGRFSLRAPGHEDACSFGSYRPHDSGVRKRTWPAPSAGRTRNTQLDRSARPDVSAKFELGPRTPSCPPPPRIAQKQVGILPRSPSGSAHRGCDHLGPDELSQAVAPACTMSQPMPPPESVGDPGLADEPPFTARPVFLGWGVELTPMFVPPPARRARVAGRPVPHDRSQIDQQAARREASRRKLWPPPRTETSSPASPARTSRRRDVPCGWRSKRRRTAPGRSPRFPDVAASAYPPSPGRRRLPGFHGRSRAIVIVEVMRAFL